MNYRKVNIKDFFKVLFPVVLIFIVVRYFDLYLQESQIIFDSSDKLLVVLIFTNTIIVSFQTIYYIYRINRLESAISEVGEIVVESEDNVIGMMRASQKMTAQIYNGRGDDESNEEGCKVKKKFKVVRKKRYNKSEM